jgi:hypothetical protein
MHLRTIVKGIALAAGVIAIVVLVTLVCIPGYFIERNNTHVRQTRR